VSPPFNLLNTSLKLKVYEELEDYKGGRKTILFYLEGKQFILFLKNNSGKWSIILFIMSKCSSSTIYLKAIRSVDIKG